MIKNCKTMEQFYSTLEEARVFFELIGFVTSMVCTGHSYRAMSDEYAILVHPNSKGTLTTFVTTLETTEIIKNNF